eukprot:EG_transcript_13132
MGYKRKKTEGPAAAEANDPKPKVVEEEEEPLEEEDPLPESEAGEAEEEEAPALTRREEWLRERTANVVHFRDLPHGLYEKELFQFLSQYGEVKRVRVPRSKKTGHPRGYAFVQFARQRVAQQVATDLNGYFLHGHVMRTRLMDPSEVKPGWHDNKALIALDKRIRLYGRPRERVRETPAPYVKPLIRRHTRKEKLRNQRLAALGLPYATTFWTDPAERQRRVAATKGLLAETPGVKWRRPETKTSAGKRKRKATGKKAPAGAKPVDPKQKQQAKKEKKGEKEKAGAHKAHRGTQKNRLGSVKRQRRAERARQTGAPAAPVAPAAAAPTPQPAGRPVKAKANGKPAKP